MSDTHRNLRAVLYALFTLSGFAGLIYESIWSHYLKLFLGHAAYAQTLVLTIFMGGMAIGAWCAGEISARLRRPLLAYAAVEALLGVAALLFDPLFRGLQGWAFDHVIPALSSGLAIDALKWGLSGAVILPQSILLGMTFPLMSAGVIRLAGGHGGRVLAWLYFTNSLGAAVGVLISGFALIALVGLPGTVLTAGLINFVLVLGVGLVLRRAPVNAAPATRAAAAGTTPWLLLAAACFTGAASFFYEIGWIRMLSLVLGSATHSFELMLSAFIFGLALGSFIIRRRIESLVQPLRTLAWVQVWMAVLALASLVVYGATFDGMATIIRALARNDAGYALFNIASHGICLALMLPVTICAGMTLPLITRLLMSSGGEAAIGRVYAANTLGAIVGVQLAVHVVMPWLGLRQVVVAGAALDLALGLWLLRAAGGAPDRRARLALVAALVVSAMIAWFVRFDPSQLASGVFRSGDARLHLDVQFHRDGKTASVDVYGTKSETYIATNGKVDAGLSLTSEASPDDFTMITAGVLPALVHPGLKTAAVIGFGSGRTTHTLLHVPGITSVDTIEIEPAMVEGARRFGALVARAYEDPRSHIHIEDAKTFFARGGARYDAIVSEPSNPWVSGVASLFSQEFYHQVRRHLNDDGVLVQWLQLYEFDLSLVGSILRALDTSFGDYALYMVGDLDMLVVASPVRAVPDIQWPEETVRGLRPLLNLTYNFGPQDVAALRIADKRTLAPLLAALGVPANSDYFPVVDQRAAKYRFFHSNVREMPELREVTSRLEGREKMGAMPPLALKAATVPIQEAQKVGRAFSGKPDPGGEDSWGPNAAGMVLTLKSLADACPGPDVAEAWVERFADSAERLLPYLSSADTRNIVAALRKKGCYRVARHTLRDWVDFFEADGTSDWPRVQLLGNKLLSGRQYHDPVTQYLVQEVLLADLHIGDRADALVWLRELKDAPDQQIGVRLLLSYVAAGLPRAR